MPGCAAMYCSNSAQKGFSMKRLPTDLKRRREWLIKMKRDNWTPTTNARLCEVHFAPEMWEKPRVDGKKKLKMNAVPTLFSFKKIEKKRKPPTERLKRLKPKENQPQETLDPLALNHHPIIIFTPIVKRLCQICLVLKGDLFLSKISSNTVYNGKETVKKMLSLVIPDLDLTRYPNSEICRTCRDLVLASYELQQIWKATEAKLRSGGPKEAVNYVDKTTSESSDIEVLEETLGSEYVVKLEDDRESITEEIENPEPGKREDVNVAQSFAKETHSPEYVAKLEDNLESIVLIEHVDNPEPDKSEDDNIEQNIQKIDNGTEGKNNLILETSQSQLAGKVEKNKESSRLCEHCGLLCSNNRQVHRHFRDNHLNLICESCGNAFYGYAELNKHIRLTHRTLKPRTRLPIANSQQRGKTSSNNIRRFQCHICGIKFTQGSFRYHMLLQHVTKMKPHKCEICGMRFMFKCRLQVHMERHSAALLSCNICGKKIKRKRHLEQHTRIFHLKKGNSICDICEQPFFKKTDMMKHKVKKHGWHPSQEGKSPEES